MTTIKLTQEEVEEINPEFPWSEIDPELIDTTRWGDLYNAYLVIPDGENIGVWRTTFEIGSGDAEYTSWDNRFPLEFKRVKQVEITRTEWVLDDEDYSN